MNEILIGSVIDKVDAQERKIDELKEKVERIPDENKILNEIKAELERLRTDISKISFPEKEIQQLSARLTTNTAVLQHPIEQKIVHRHHVPKIISIAAVLFLLVCLLSAAWYMTTENLQTYKANDTKYRYLKLEANTSLSKWLGIIDSLNLVDPKMRDAVITKEEQNKRSLEMMQRVAQMKKEAKELKEKMKDENGKTQ